MKSGDELWRERIRNQREIDLLHMEGSRKRMEIEILFREREALRRAQKVRVAALCG